MLLEFLSKLFSAIRRNRSEETAVAVDKSLEMTNHEESTVDLQNEIGKLIK
jgi:hypothetical protein